MKALVSGSQDTPQIKLVDLDDPQPNTDQALIDLELVLRGRSREP